MIYFILLLVSIIWGVSVNTFFSAWISMEINMMIFLSCMINTPKSFVWENGFKYYVIQSLASGVFLMFILIGLTTLNAACVAWGALMSLMLKLGAAPLHIWFVEISAQTTWFNFFLLSTFQKILPYSYLLQMGLKSDFVVLTGVLMSLAGSLGQLNLKKIFAYSSLFTLSWMLASENAYWGVWFLLAYASALSIITFSLSQHMALSVSDVLLYMQNLSLFIFFISLFSLAGIPPLLGFFAKVCMLQVLISTAQFPLAMMLAQSSLVFIYIYLSLFMPSVTWCPEAKMVKTNSWVKCEMALFMLVIFGGGFLFLLHKSA